MTEEQFLDQISPVPDNNFIYFAKADLSLGIYAFSRAYINFVKQEDIFIFKDKFDDYVFVDAKGNEFPAIVEFAPFQKIPKRRNGPDGLPISAKKRDNKSGTIEDDPEYLSFLESLEELKNEANLPSAEIYLEEMEAREKELRANKGCPKMTTPLIDFVLQRRADRQKHRDERYTHRRETKQLLLNENRHRGKNDETHKKIYTKEKPLPADKSEKQTFPSRKFDTKVKADRKESYKNKPNEKQKFDRKDRSTSEGDNYSGQQKEKFVGNGSKKGPPKQVEKHQKPKPDNARSTHDHPPSNQVKEDKSHRVDREQTHERPVRDDRDKVKVVRTRDDSDKDVAKAKPFREEREPRDKPPRDNRPRDRPVREDKESAKESASKEEKSVIKNKDRPAQAIYRPGSKKTSHSEGAEGGSSSRSSEGNKERTSKPRVFTNNARKQAS